MMRSSSPNLIWLMLAACVGCGGGTYVPPSTTPDVVKMNEIRTQLVSASVSSEAAEKQVLANPTGTARLRGKFVLDGSAPPNPTLPVNKDLGTCMPGGQPVLDQLVITGPGSGLANVLIYADGIPDEWCHPDMIGDTATVDFDQKNCLFINRIFAIETTQTVRLLNSDNVGHNADMKPTKNRKFNPNIPGGGEALYPEDGKELKEERAPFGVSCSAHPWMKSYMIFRKNGYFAVTKEDGSFEIPQLPAGVDIKFVVWHEAANHGQPGALTDEFVQADSNLAKGWSKRGTFTVNLAPDSENDLKVVVSSSTFSK